LDGAFASVSRLGTGSRRAGGLWHVHARGEVASACAGGPVGLWWLGAWRPGAWRGLGV